MLVFSSPKLVLSLVALWVAGPQGKGAQHVRHAAPCLQRAPEEVLHPSTVSTVPTSRPSSMAMSMAVPMTSVHVTHVTTVVVLLIPDLRHGTTNMSTFS